MTQLNSNGLELTKQNSMQAGICAACEETEKIPVTMSEQPSCKSSDGVKTEIKSDYPVGQSGDDMESFHEDGATLSGQHDCIESSLNRELKLVNRGELLGEGTFGKVYQGLYNGCNQRIPPRMAIKVVHTKDKALLRKLHHELELLKTLNHPNIVKYYGCVMNEEKGEAEIYMELMPHTLSSSYKEFGAMNDFLLRKHTT
jgi:serine/threonine protein kinase